MATAPAVNPQEMDNGAGAPPLYGDQSQAPQIDPRNLPREYWYPLWQLLMELELLDDIPRREEVKRILQRRLFFRSQQDWYWNEGAGTWYPPNNLPAGAYEDGVEPRTLRYPVNIIQPTALSLSSVITQNNCNPQFYPEKAGEPQHVATAKSASKIWDLIQRNNDWQKVCDDFGYAMGTDGFFGAHVRYVSDGDRFGTDTRDILAGIDVPAGPAMTICQNCGYAEEGTTEQTPTCPECGEPMQDHQEMATVPVPVGTVEVPRGQEVVSCVPALQLRRSMMADDQPDFLYMDWVTDIDKAVIMATYPEKEDSLNTSTTGDDSGTASSYERIARRLLYLNSGRYTGQVLDGLGTFRRAWIRPKAFFRITDKAKRQWYLQNYPKGVKLVFFNDVYCESLPQSMDSCWETMQTMPGEGQIRETLISAIMPIQEMLNDCIDLLFDICMNGVPEGFADSNLLDFEARGLQSNFAGNITPITLPPNQNIGQKMLFTQAVSPSAAMMQFIQWLLNEIPQFLSGNYPALSGGDTGSNDTAAGITIQRNQAMGRIGRVWRRFQMFLANVAAKSVKCFAENRTEDVEIPKLGVSGSYESDFISIQDTKGNVLAYPETDAQFPVLEADVRAILLNMFNSANPIFTATISDPANLEYFYRMAGIQDIQVPGQAQRKKTYADIQLLAQQQPEQAPQPDAQGQPVLLPSIKPDPNVDDLNIAGDTAKKWLISDDGMAIQGTPGYENVKAYSEACTQLAKEAQLQQAIAAQGLAGKGPGADLAGAESMTPPPHQQPQPKGANSSTTGPQANGAAPEGEQ